ncbi:hypothetical protein Tco_0397789 [Tanacetum coccineum]
MAKSVSKYSIYDPKKCRLAFVEAVYIPAGVHPTAPGRDKTIIQFSAAPSCFTKPPDSIKSWTDHFFWVDSCAFPIFVPLYTGGILEKDSAPLLTARQEETVRLLESHKAPFRRYPECFLCQIWVCWISFRLLTLGRGSSSAAAAEVPVPTEERQEDVASEDAYLNLADLDEDAIAVRQGEERVVSEQPKKVKKRRLIMPEGSHLLAWEQPVAPSVVHPSQKGEGFVDLSAQWSFQILATAESSGTLSAPVDTVAAATTSTRPATAFKAATDIGPSHLEESESPDDSFYEIPNVDPAMAKRWYVPQWNITNDSLLDDAFSCRTLVDRVAPPAFFFDLRTMGYDQLFTEFNVGASRKICLGSEVRSRTAHELELKEKLRAKYVACGKLLEERDLEILELKSKLAEKDTEAAEVIRLRDQVSSLSREKSALTAEVSVLKVTIAQKDHASHFACLPMQTSLFLRSGLVKC